MRFSYVQIGCESVENMVKFYTEALDFVPSKEGSKWLTDKKGVALEAPGYTEDKKIIFGFVKGDKGANRQINDRGYAHICFETNDVEANILRLVKHGGSFQSTLEKPEKNPCVYTKDIEGNVVEFHIPFPNKKISSYFKTVACLLHLKKDKELRKEGKSTKNKFIHVNMISDDWRKLCDFYNNTFKSSDFGKIKDHEGEFKEKVIGVKGVHVIGKHVLLPDFYDTYPTFEVFTYSIKGNEQIATLHDLGINCIGFTSTDLEKDIKTIVDNGGKEIKKLSDNTPLLTDIQGSRIILKK